MAEYINRDEALDSVSWDTEAYTAINMLDTVEIIRCKDCKWNNMGECEHFLGLLVANDENFCSYAERRDDG